MTAIKIENVSKVYRLGAKEQTHENVISAMLSSITSPIKNYKKYRSLYNFDDIDFDNPDNNTDNNILWALKNVSFSVEKGEVVGIIGRNGAGKSTLLKILSKITPPARGRVEIHGRTASLLEVGTGFHPELTGRENVYLNGTVLGMRKAEVDRKFDEIVEFSGIEKFLDTPVKRYSSGMSVRLAFAVAAHLEPEILIVDEVLAVGDAAFQQKCLNKMQDVSGDGRTVFFVSHNMPAVTRLCQRCIMLSGGELVADGAAHDIVASYMHEGFGTSSEKQWEDANNAPGGETVRLRKIRVRNEQGQTIDSVDIRKPVAIEMTIEVLKGGYVILPVFHLINDDGIVVFASLDSDKEWRSKQRPSGTYVCTGWIPGNFLSEGNFFITAGTATLNPVVKEFKEQDVIGFNVVDSTEGDSARGDWANHLPGVVRPLLKWETDFSK